MVQIRGALYHRGILEMEVRYFWMPWLILHNSVYDNWSFGRFKNKKRRQQHLPALTPAPRLQRVSYASPLVCTAAGPYNEVHSEMSVSCHHPKLKKRLRVSRRPKGLECGQTTTIVPCPELERRLPSGPTAQTQNRGFSAQNLVKYAWANTSKPQVKLYRFKGLGELKRQTDK